MMIQILTVLNVRYNVLKLAALPRL